MKKMIVLTSLWSFLFIFSFSMFGCSEDDDEFGTTAERGNEVRTPRLLIILDVSVEITYAIRNAICL